MVFLLIAEEVLPINQGRALGGPGTIVESVDKLGRLHSFPLGREIAIAEEVGCHPGDRGMRAGIFEANVLRHRQSSNSIGIDGGPQSKSGELPVEFGVKYPPQGCLIAINVGRFQGSPAGSTVGRVDEEQMGVDMRIGMPARLVDVFGRNQIAGGLGEACPRVVLSVSEAFKMVEQAHDRDSEGSLDCTSFL